MTTIAKTALAVALSSAAGVSAVVLTDSPMQAMSLHGPGSPAYAASRISEAFDVVATMPPVEPVRVPMATKGDLLVPLGCFGVPDPADCADAAFQVPHAPSIVMETRLGNTSILTRVDTATVANVGDDEAKLGRIVIAFEVVSGMPQVSEVRIPMAIKGDLPVALPCIGLPNDAQAGCVDRAYKGFTEPSFVVATSFGNTTTLLRRDAMTVAEVFDKVFWHSGQRDSVSSE